MQSEQDKITIDTLEHYVRVEVREAFEDLESCEADDAYDKCIEIADSNVPLYTQTLLEVALSDSTYSVAMHNIECEVSQKDLTIVRVCTLAIYEILYDHALNELEIIKTRLEEERDDADSE